MLLALKINLYRTDLSCKDSLYFDCLTVPFALRNNYGFRQVITYCLTQCPVVSLTVPVLNDQLHLTFHQLAQKNITSRQLYLWSASIDVIENYQHYLNQRDSTEHHPSEDDVFYNCTWPQFGSRCQYTFDHLPLGFSSSSSLTELAQDFYSRYPYEPTTLTCYEHLKCNRGSTPSCLDWTEICDGKMDCLDDGADEENCWKLEVNECERDEHRCENGQCIPKAFFRDNTSPFDCLDKSDEIGTETSIELTSCPVLEPTFFCEDIACLPHSLQSESALTSSCQKSRQNLITKILFSVRSDGLSDECWFPLRCLLHLPLYPETICKDDYTPMELKRRVMLFCPDRIWFIPSFPVLFGHVYFGYSKEKIDRVGFKMSPGFFCFNHKFCNIIPISNTSIKENNLTCHEPEKLNIIMHQSPFFSWFANFIPLISNFFVTCNTKPDGFYSYCQQHNYYRCINSSKCISNDRLLNSIKDCFNGDDEQVDLVTKHLSVNPDEYFFKCDDTNVYISRKLVNDGLCHCPPGLDGICADESSDLHYSQTHLSYQTICDGFIELRPILIDGYLMTDETNCDYWSCNNIYTRCNKIWNCIDGRDEINCSDSTTSICSSNHNECISVETNTLICIPSEKFYDNHVDCVGGADEPQLCRTHDFINKKDYFHCRNDTEHTCLRIFHFICDSQQHCLHGDDEHFCTNSSESHPFSQACQTMNWQRMSDTEKHICQRFPEITKRSFVHFTLIDHQTWEKQQENTMNNLSSIATFEAHKDQPPYQSPCHRGLPLRFAAYHHQNNQTTTLCLCPPSLYGSNCQYQNQRIALTLKFRALSDSWQTLFAVAIFLVHHDPLTQDTRIHSVQQFTYLPMRDCQLKFHQYLLYATRPFNTSFNYSIHIHIYDKITFVHRSTWHILVSFPFLPVNRVALLLDIPSSKDESLCTDIKCGSHGRCISLTQHRKSSTIDDRWYCQCDRGWSGRFCTDRHNSSCSSDSIDLGALIDGRSICLCSLETFGDRCLILNDVCHQTNDKAQICLNGGRCIPNDDRDLNDNGRSYSTFMCICPKGFTGDRCEMRQSQLIFSFDASSIHVPESMLLHFIQYHHDRRHDNATTIKPIPINQDSVTVHWSQPFHLAFIELHRHQYYLAIMQKTVMSPNDTITKRISSSDRCPHISELFNDTLLNYHPLRRIKYYHLLCQSRPATSSSSVLSCFYDQDHLCVCDWFEGRERQANCLQFNHDMKMDCLGQNGCENDARCFQDHPTCPQTSMCVCPKCFYGRRCQFSMSRFSLSLDGILGYHVKTKVSFTHQLPVIKVSLFLTIFMSVTGFINGLLALITFKNQESLRTGCGYYLLGSSVATMFTMVIFSMKYGFFYVSQSGYIKSRISLHLQCITLDFLLRISLNMNQWLNACVACDRILTTIQGVTYDSAKSRRNAKYIMVILSMMVVSTAIYDPIHRRLINDNNNEEDRVWCIASYPSWLRTLDLFINVVHFFVPFLINIVSAIIIIWKKAQRSTHVHTNSVFQVVLRAELKEHKHLLMSPILIVLLSLPRLIISVLSGCVNSNRRSWLFLTGYLCSFLPTMLTFLLFVLPSQFYTNQFHQSINRYSRSFQSRLFSI